MPVTFTRSKILFNTFVCCLAIYMLLLWELKTDLWKPNIIKLYQASKVILTIETIIPLNIVTRTFSLTHKFWDLLIKTSLKCPALDRGDMFHCIGMRSWGQEGTVYRVQMPGKEIHLLGLKEHRPVVNRSGFKAWLCRSLAVRRWASKFPHQVSLVSLYIKDS